MSEGHSLPKKHRGRDRSGHGKKVSEQGSLACWRGQMEG